MEMEMVLMLGKMVLMLGKMVMMISMMLVTMVITMVTISPSGRSFPWWNLPARVSFPSPLVSSSQRRRNL